MNHRDYKEFAAGECYHLFNRGTGKIDIFRDEKDHDFLLGRLAEYLFPDRADRWAPSAVADGAHLRTGSGRYQRRSFPPGSFSLIAYCLMPNHFHFLIRQNGNVPLSTLMLNLWSGYSKYFNKKYERVGSLFQDQFKAVLVDDDTYLKWLSAYIHLNPVTARLVRGPLEYPYSSYAEYAGTGGRGLCDSRIVLEQFRDTGSYRDFVRENADAIRERKDVERFLIDHA